MKIVYIVNHDLTKQSGVTKKVTVQVDYWESKGHEVQIYCTNATTPTVDSPRIKFYKDIGRIVINQDLLDDLATFEPDIVYYRYSIFGRTLYRIVNHYKCIGEANTFEVKEFWGLFKKYRKISHLLLFLSNKFLRPLIISKSKGLITVTHEMAAYSENSRYCERTLAIPNGINIEKYKPLKNIESKDEKPVRLFFMGSPDQPWHGVDLIESMASKLPEFEFHIVGMKGKETDNTFFHGYLSSEEYSKLLKNCHICLGSLALYRNGMNEGSALKVREYIALGYPVIVGHDDCSIIDSGITYPWFKKIDFQNEKSEIILNEIRDFCNKFSVYEVPETDKLYFSVEHTEEKRLAFFESILTIE